MIRSFSFVCLLLSKSFLWFIVFSLLSGLIFVVDSADSSRFTEAASEMSGIIQEINEKKVKLNNDTFLAILPVK